MGSGIINMWMVFKVTSLRVSVDRKGKWSEDRVLQCLVHWGDEGKPINEGG